MLGYHELPRVALIDNTPLTRLPRLSKALNINLYLKRDDIGLFGGGGNKLRKLEYLLPPALKAGADTLITFGALQSNHARLTAAVAAHLGLECHLILSHKVGRNDPDYLNNGNISLNHIMGANLHILEADDDAVKYAQQLQEKLSQEGRTPWIIPFGGSDAHGVAGYVRCVEELATDAQNKSLDIQHIVHASGSGGTQAGLVIGAHNFMPPARVLGISVLAPAKELITTIDELLEQFIELTGTCPVLSPDEIQVNDQFIGQGYGLPSTAGIEAINTMAGQEAVLLDPVYTGKAFAGLLALAQEGYFAAGDNVVFVHTGGLPGIFAYANLWNKK